MFQNMKIIKIIAKINKIVKFIFKLNTINSLKKLLSTWKHIIMHLYRVDMVKIAMLLFDCKKMDLDWTIDVIVLFIAIHLEIVLLILIYLSFFDAVNLTLSEVNIKVLIENKYFNILRNKIKRSYKLKVGKNTRNQN